MKIFVLCYYKIYVRYFSSEVKALQFKDTMCNQDSSLDPTDFWVKEVDVDNMEM